METHRLPPRSPHPGRETQPKDPGLKRSDSFPARLLSDKPRRPEIKHVRPPITRPAPDAKPPASFETHLPGQADGQRIKEGALRKQAALAADEAKYGPTEKAILRDPDAQEFLRSRHPGYERYNEEKKAEVMEQLLNHPRLRAMMAQARNEIGALPNGATGTRMMREDEQRFLTGAFQGLRDGFKDKPFHIHGETALVGDKDGKIVESNYSPEGNSYADIEKGDRYHLHTHPPFLEPFTSSASGADHSAAALMYTALDNKMDAYVTNGKDVLHISPSTNELAKLVPDPAAEERLGKFPVAYELPDPQERPYPFSNHEAPAAAKPWDPKR